MLQGGVDSARPPRVTVGLLHLKTHPNGPNDKIMRVNVSRLRPIVAAIESSPRIIIFKFTKINRLRDHIV